MWINEQSCGVPESEKVRFDKEDEELNQREREREVWDPKVCKGYEIKASCCKFQYFLILILIFFGFLSHSKANIN